LKIAIVRSTLHRGSGQAVHISELSKQLIRLGNFVRIYSRSIEYDSLSAIGLEFKFPADSIPFVRHFGFSAACLSGIGEFDVVHTQYHPAIIAGNLMHQVKKQAHVFTYHGFAPIRIWRNSIQKLKMIDHRVGTYFSVRLGLDRIIAVSNFLKKELVSWYHLDPELVEVVYNGVDLERFNPRMDGQEARRTYSLGDKPIVAFVGRLAPYKGPQFLLETIPQVLKEIPEAKFVFVGSARFDVPSIGQIIRRSDIRKAVRFTGYVSDQMLPAFYSSCDVFCYPSLWEGFGLTPAEAQAAGKPVVAFNTCALPEVVEDGVTGYLVPPRDSAALGEAIVKLLSDSDLRRRMGREGRLRAERMFSWEKAARQTMTVYEEALKVHESHR
jgi:glycosyltransferase involved in cell wall biosynthesis